VVKSLLTSRFSRLAPVKRVSAEPPPSRIDLCGLCGLAGQSLVVQACVVHLY
jgi:hypothetical protein